MYVCMYAYLIFPNQKTIHIILKNKDLGILAFTFLMSTICSKKKILKLM